MAPTRSSPGADLHRLESQRSHFGSISLPFRLFLPLNNTSTLSASPPMTVAFSLCMCIASTETEITRSTGRNTTDLSDPPSSTASGETSATIGTQNPSPDWLCEALWDTVHCVEVVPSQGRMRTPHNRAHSPADSDRAVTCCLPSSAHTV
ncbi:hypothetical protein AAFF_G00311120 [Aldrovandia affinis]|uniref:Uncharacterized protein n=1 Tax=Aldrovandia affinis TaxID=143900 RepID=A0AAD7R871_9TELE|nr:hypothetical protein AAFF_G00311120 [Aldrovandia affinis]